MIADVVWRLLGGTIHTDRAEPCSGLAMFLATIALLGAVQASTGAEGRDPSWFFRSDEYPFYAIIYPHAEYYKGRTYVAFQHTGMDPHVMAFDHVNGTWSTAVRVADNPIPDDDTHGNPALWIDKDGRIHLIYGCHGRRAKHVRSNRPEDISSWEQLPDVAPRCTYPQISRFSNGDLLLFFRSGGHSIKNESSPNKKG